VILFKMINKRPLPLGAIALFERLHPNCTVHLGSGVRVNGRKATPFSEYLRLQTHRVENRVALANREYAERKALIRDIAAQVRAELGKRGES